MFSWSLARCTTVLTVCALTGLVGPSALAVAEPTGPSQVEAPAASSLAGVEALAQGNVWSVGWRQAQGGPTQTLARHWTGTAWSTVPTPSPGDKANQLAGVSAVSPDDIWAVGTFQNSLQREKLLAMHWNGTRWVHVAVPQRRSAARFAAVAAIAPDDAWAVGYKTDGTGIVDHWDGHSWSTVSAFPDLGRVILHGVDATSSNDVWVVGERIDGRQNSSTFAAHWDGQTWQAVTTPDGHRYTALAGVSMLSSNKAWAAGHAADDGNANGLLLRWDGQTWSVVKSPALVGDNVYLNSISAVSAGDVWAVGSDFTPAGDSLTLIEHWDGSRWQRVASPSPESFDNLSSVSADSASDAWTVGAVYTGGRLVEHWNGNRWTTDPTG